MKSFTLILRCPDIRSQEDAEVVREVLSSSPGIDTVDVDYATHTVRASTFNDDGGTDVRRRLDDAGFPCEE
jgi:hypothetical protein